MESIQVAAEAEEDPTRELRKMVPRRLSLLFLLFFLLDNTTLPATKSSRDSTIQNQRSDNEDEDERPRILLLLLPQCERKITQRILWPLEYDNLYSTTTVGANEINSETTATGRRSGNSLKLLDYFPDSKQTPSSSTSSCSSKNLSLLQDKKTASGCCSVRVCVCVSLSLHVQMLRVFFAFPSFLHRVAHHHHSKWDNHCYQRQQKHSYQAWERWHRRNFLLHQTNGCKSNSFCFAKNYQNKMQCNTWSNQKKVLSGFFIFMGCSLNWVFVRFMSSWASSVAAIALVGAGDAATAPKSLLPFFLEEEEEVGGSKIK